MSQEFESAESMGAKLESALFTAHKFVRTATGELPKRFSFEGLAIPVADVSADFAAFNQQNESCSAPGFRRQRSKAITPGVGLGV